MTILNNDLLIFIEKLQQNNRAIWNDCYGSLEVVIGNELIFRYLNQNNSKIIISDFLNLKGSEPLMYNNIISIGAFEAINEAKIEAQFSKVDLTIIPIPVSNDSFGTNRCSNKSMLLDSSIKCIFAKKVIFDIDALLNFGIDSSVNGIGEYIGLYYSIIDYFLKNNETPDVYLLEFIVKNLEELFNLDFKKERTIILKNICILLIIKCLVMRLNHDHEIGCGIDHSFARVLEKNYNIVHGKAVLLGSIISSNIFPNWSVWGLDTDYIINIGRKYEIISELDVKFLMNLNIEILINDAIKIRRNRKTMLTNLNKALYIL